MTCTLTQCTHHKGGPFIISCNKENIFLKVEKTTNRVIATNRIREASNFFIVTCDQEESNYFNIVYEAPTTLYGDDKCAFEAKVGKIERKPTIPMYLCASVNWLGKKRQPLQMQVNGKASQCRMALRRRRSKHFQPADLTEWVNEKDVFFINCQERSLKKLRNSYLCVYTSNEQNTDTDSSPISLKTNHEVNVEPDSGPIPQEINEQNSDTDPSSSSTDKLPPLTIYTTGCEPDISVHSTEGRFMLFRLLKPKINDSTGKK